MRSPLVLFAILSLCACETGTPSGGPVAGDETARAPAPTAPGSPSGGPEDGDAKQAPQERTPKIREVSASVIAGAFEVRARLFLSKGTPDDGVRVALAISSAPGQEAPKGTSIPHAWHKTLASLKFHVATGGKTTTLQVATEPPSQVGYIGGPAGDLHFVTLTEAGLDEHEKQLAWKQAAPGVLSSGGSYTVRIEGDVHADSGATAFALGPLPFEVVVASDAFKPLSALAPLALAKAAAQGGKGEPRVDRHVVEDVAGGRWHRFTFPSAGYDVRVVEVLLAPDGRVESQHAYDHFTCVATSTPIETPAGPVPIERVREGDVVVGFDLERGEPIETIVRKVTSAMVDDVLDLGGLRVTASHPVFADGEFIPAGRLAVGATLRGWDHTAVPLESIRLSNMPTLVFDLSVDWPHNFYAGGLLVHNKAVHVPLGPRDDRWGGVFHWALAGPG